MALPTSRIEFAAFIKRQLGDPVLEVNVTDEQVDDAISIALSYYADYHFDASQRVYFSHIITDTDVANRYIEIPESIIGVVQLFPIGDALSVQNMFSIRYQIALNDLYNLTNLSLVPYYQAMQYVQMIEQILVGRMPIRYARHMNRCYIDGDWTKIQVGTYIILECHQVIDPETFTDVWKDRWLLRYATALLKRQWGNNLKKFEGLKLPSGITISGKEIYDSAVAEIEEIENDMIHSFSTPCLDMIG